MIIIVVTNRIVTSLTWVVVLSFDYLRNKTVGYQTTTLSLRVMNYSGAKAPTVSLLKTALPQNVVMLKMCSIYPFV